MRLDNPVDAENAVGLYALVGMLLCLSWMVFFHYLSRRPELLADGVEEGFFQRERTRVWVGIMLYAVAGVLGVLLTPLLGVVIFLSLTVFYAITSQGLDALPSPLKRATAR